MHFFNKILIFLVVSVTAQAAQQTVCTVTINSSDEKDVFKKHLAGQNFKFVELTELAGKSSEDKKNDQWFQKACEQQVQCDVLLVSGHFGGTFFGKSGLSLSADTLEQQSCSGGCEGILGRPREVFLFGCNTLAGKEKDSRTPEEYLRVLLHDDVPRDEAERVVQARYGALGDSFHDRMRRIFTKIPHIYGFNSVGPSGANVKGFLDNYFKKIPNYANHLLVAETQHAVDLITIGNKGVQNMNSTVQANLVLADALKLTSFTQCPGITEEDPAYDIKKSICALY
jgi:hypothetical protein